MQKKAHNNEVSTEGGYMDNIFEMGTTARHGRILDFLVKATFELFVKKELINFSESSSLVYYGNKK